MFTRHHHKGKEGHDIPSWLSHETDQHQPHPNDKDEEKDPGSTISASKKHPDTSWAERAPTPPSPKQKETAEETTSPFVDDEETPLFSSPKKKHKISPSGAKSSTDNANKIQKPRRNCCHAFFIFINFIAVFGAFCMIACQLIPMFFLELNNLQKALRIYIAFFCFMFILAELEPPFLPFAHNFQHLGNFVSRGFLYTFLGVIGMEQAVAIKSTGVLNEMFGKNRDGHDNFDYDMFALLFMKTSSWLITGVGVAYFVMGVFFLQRLRDRCREGYKQRVIKYEAAKLERRGDKSAAHERV